MLYITGAMCSMSLLINNTMRTSFTYLVVMVLFAMVLTWLPWLYLPRYLPGCHDCISGGTYLVVMFCIYHVTYLVALVVFTTLLT